MTPLELNAIKDRISTTICETWRGDHDGNGNMICVIEGRISADDFMVLLAEIERLNKSIVNLKHEPYAHIGASYPCT